MSGEQRRRYPILYSVQRWNDGKWFYGGFFIILVVLTAIGTFFRGPGWSWVWPWQGS